MFVQTDDPSGNSVIAYSRSASGSLHQVATYLTGGEGGILTGSVVDHLASQGSVGLDSGTLYVTNAGSNTISVFDAHGQELNLRQTTGTGGTFPVSIAVHGNLVYVLNARGGGSIQGYLRVAGHLVRIPSWHRALGLDPTLIPET